MTLSQESTAVQSQSHATARGGAAVHPLGSRGLPVLDRAAARLYERYGALGTGAACIVTSLAIGMLTTVVTVIWLARYLGATTTEALEFLALSVPTILVCFTVAYATCVGRLRNAIPLTTSRDPADASHAWDIAERLPRTILLRCALAVSIAAVPIGVFAANAVDQPGWVAGPIAAAMIAGVLASSALVNFTNELLIRPIKRDVATRLPDGFEPRVKDLRLQTKAVLPLPIVTLFTALTVGAFADISSGPERLATVLAIAIVMSAVAAAVFLVISTSALGPLHDLAEGTRRVAKRDLSTRVPIVTADDLGELTSGFNQMVAGLRERELLSDENASLIERLRGASARIVATADAERRRMERDLHDGAQQNLVLLNLKLGALERQLERDPAAARGGVEELREELGRALDELRDLAHGIYPAVLENEGLPSALRDASERAAIPASFSAAGAGRYPSEVEAAVYFCCLEALQNAAKHAGEGATATVSLEERNGELRFKVADDGAGFDPASANGSAGMQNMADRIGALGGELRVDSRPGGGTTVAGSIPVGGTELQPDRRERR